MVCSGVGGNAQLRTISGQVLGDFFNDGLSQFYAALADDSGYFYFFNPDNVEVTLKVLRGCGVNNHYWVFAGGLTDVEVSFTVTDTQTATTRTYQNPQSTAFQPILDTSAFATCP